MIKPTADLSIRLSHVSAVRPCLIWCHECRSTPSLFDNCGKIVESENIMAKALKLITEGKIVAIKGIGGYHLVCDATNDEAVQLLRERKKRPSKPFGVMVKDIDIAKKSPS